jgi:GntR family transcriptional repressor for pyruvate dehydrogenase complex
LAATDTEDVILEPVKRSRIYEHIVEQIHALIREGRWAPGDQIPPERELAERFRVSRTSVREALRALEMQGMIESRQGGGTFVRSAEPEARAPPLVAAILRGRREMTEVLEVRELIEPGIARRRRCAPPRSGRRTGADLDRQRSHRPTDPSSTKTSPSLHAARAADNHILLRLHNVILTSCASRVRPTCTCPTGPQMSLRGHESILAAVRANDGGAAQQASLAHITEVRGHPARHERDRYG